MSAPSLNSILLEIKSLGEQALFVAAEAQSLEHDLKALLITVSELRGSSCVQ